METKRNNMHRVTEKDLILIGDIKDFPIEVVKKMVDEQVNQGNPADVRVFQERNVTGRHRGGFNWAETTDGDGFWSSVILGKSFDLFFDKYPKEMKKYWIKDLTENQVIHAPTEDIAEKLCEKFDMLGLKWDSGVPYPEILRWDMCRAETCYLPSKGEYCDLSYYTQQGYEILTIEQLLDFQENEYPKVMEVSGNGNGWVKRVVFMEKNGKFLAWVDAESLEEAEHEVNTCPWPYAREIQPAPTLELTLDEIADKFGISVDRLKIKK